MDTGFSFGCPTFGACPMPEVCYPNRVNGKNVRGPGAGACDRLSDKGAVPSLVSRTEAAPGLIELAVRLGLIQEAHTAIVALDQTESAREDLEEEHDGGGFAETVLLVCACCGGTGELGREEIP